MKYLLTIPLFLLVGVSFVIGAICYCWSFKKQHFKKGMQWLNKQFNFVNLLDKLIEG